MNVRVEEFEDKGEKGPDGAHDYFYKGKYFYFEDGDMKVIVRTHGDTPDEASFLSLNDRPFDADTVRHPLLEQIGLYLRKKGFTKLKLLCGERGGYEPFEFWRRE